MGRCNIYVNTFALQFKAFAHATRTLTNVMRSGPFYKHENLVSLKNKTFIQKESTSKESTNNHIPVSR